MSAHRRHLPFIWGALLVCIGVLAVGVPSAFASSPAATKPVATGTVYGGYTSQDNPFVLKLAADHRHIAGAVLEVDAPCADGSNFSYYGAATFEPTKPPTVDRGDTVFAPDTLSRTGAIAVSGTGTQATSGPLVAFAAKLTGHVRGDRATGTFAAAIVLLDPQTGDPVTTCRTGTLQWLAVSAAKRVFAGVTSQGLPVVVQETTSATAVDHLRFGWLAPCSDQATLLIGDDLKALPLSASGIFDRSSPLDDMAGTQSVHAQYAVHGHVTGTLATGTLGVSVAMSDSASGMSRTCDTGSVHWTARSSAKASASAKGTGA